LRRRMEDEKFNNSVSDWSVEGALSEIQRWLRFQRKLGLKHCYSADETEIITNELNVQWLKEENPILRTETDDETKSLTTH
jgi:hypothetical protein